MKVSLYVLAWVFLQIPFVFLMVFLGVGVWAFHLGMMWGAATQIFLFLRYIRI